ncbi:putative esterase [Jeotgalibacillus malaysiensis]|uniref:Putative esterase n=1 Tax=Jeotgalibacillus malaysiensis TaxID=1508404 RepID=A0A0B5AWA2_9BACL|nr:alpha/beta hydrolase family protein [Jeotgalibacillus malaysiensis]AJD92848.1 putative esterase [Jeotgalibacillus malaysiensis]
MPLFEINLSSAALGIQTAVNVILPISVDQKKLSEEHTYSYGDRKFPVLYLLHGASDDYSCWMRWSSIERYANEKGIAVVMPSADLSAYTNMKHGHDYWTYISEELPAFIEATFPVSTKREDTFAAGLSMGGYGAFKLALLKPEKFAAAASLSGALDMADRVRKDRKYDNAFGDHAVLDGTENDLLHLVKMAEGDLPRLFQACGTEDFLYEDNIRFKKLAEERNLDLTYEEEPGDHDWAYWDMKIQRVLEWL